MITLIPELQVRAITLLTLLQEENIRTPEAPHEEGRKLINQRINILRPIIQKIAEQYPAPGLTECVALTLLKIGACRELVQRFALEYFLHFKTADVSLIFAVNDQNLSGDNHCFCLVGKVVADDGLIVGRGAQPTCYAKPEFFIPIRKFLSQQPKDTVVVDPLLNFYDIANNSCKTLLDYCKDHKITHIIGVRQFTEIFMENAALIKANAKLVADKMTFIQARVVKDVHEPLIELMHKFKLDSSDVQNVTVREQALRRAAMAGTKEDISKLMFLSTPININAQDDNPIKRNTALHIALIHKHFDNANFLISLGAKMDIANADGVTANDLVQKSRNPDGISSTK